jgi:hypothetical protein
METNFKTKKKKVKNISAKKCEEQGFKPYIRAKAGFKCEVCKRNDIQLHVHHIEGKQTNYMRLLEANGILLCAECHKFGFISAHSDSSSGQAQFRDKLIQLKGQKFMDMLALSRRNSPKMSKEALNSLFVYYKNKLNDL